MSAKARPPIIVAVVVAAGRGIRASGDVPKQYRRLGKETVLGQAVRAFLRHPAIAAVLPVIHPDDAALFAATVDGLDAARLLPPAAGGDTRQLSVKAGIDALAAEPPDLVLVHDAARPFVTAALIDRAVMAAAAHGAAVPGIAVTDTVLQVEGGIVTGTPARDTLRAVQTPQAFRYALLAACHARAQAAGQAGFTDDGSLVRAFGHPLHVFPGEPENRKLTRPEDFVVPLVTRVGNGFDVHAFGPGNAVMLGGVRIPHPRGLVGHSDADVVLHALTDAVLGTVGAGDIGTHFPPSDPAWRGASSDRFLAHAVALLREAGGVLDHLDATVLCEAPKIGPHRDAMRGRIAAITGLAVDQVSVKATTTERLGFTGRGEGIAASATATARLPRTERLVGST